MSRVARLGEIAWLIAGAVLLCACAAAVRAPRESASAATFQPLALSHLWVTTGKPPAEQSYTVLGKVSFSEPWSEAEADPRRWMEKLRALAIEKFPHTVDALIDMDSELSSDGTTVTVSAKAVQYGPKYRRPVTGPIAKES